jgi:type IV pilus assembly protein PilV
MSRVARGFTLLEVLVALVIFSFGMLGMAGLLTVSVRTNHSAYLRTQAFLLAQDIADRMRANAPALWQSPNPYKLNSITVPPATPAAVATGPYTDPCASASCTPAQVAVRDLALWQSQVSQFLPNAGAALVCQAAAASGTPKAPYSTTCEIQMSWTQLAITNETVQPDIFDWVFQP